VYESAWSLQYVPQVKLSPCLFLTEHHATKEYWGVEMSGQLHAPATPPQGKSPCYPLDRSLGGPQNGSGRSGEEKNSQPQPGLEPPLIQSVAQRYTTEQSQVLYSMLHRLENFRITRQLIWSTFLVHLTSLPGRGMKLTTRLHLIPRLGIRGTKSPHPIRLLGVVLI
jgi:hypothetical protein